MPTAPKPPTGELKGAATSVPAIPPQLSGGVPGWGLFVQEGEHVPEWRWPDYTTVVDRMLYESQLWSLFMGLVAPLLAYDWAIDPGEADADHAEALAGDLGLPVGLPDEEEYAIEPGTWRFNFVEHLWESLLALAFGHYYFEQSAVYDESDGLFHLRKLDPRPPSTIVEILVDTRDGGLRGIRQTGVVVRRGAQLWGAMPLIEVDRLVGYVWLPDGKRRWIGRSMMRPCYAPYLLKDRLQRVDAINHERAGGVPGFETDQSYQGASMEELRQLASEFRVGEESGWAAPAGAKLVMARAGGTDVVGSMRYHDEGMARAWSGMVRQLGQTITGSRALGQTDAALEAILRQVVATWFAGVFREHVIEDWWRWNLDVQANGRPWPHPRLVFRAPEVEQAATGEQPAAGGAPDPGGPPVAARSRPRRARPGAAERHGELGSADGRGESRAGSHAPTTTREGRPLLAAAGSLPARPLRRQPYDHEVRAAVDFAALDAIYAQTVPAVEALFAQQWLPEQASAVRQAIAYTKAGNVRQRVTKADLAKIAAPVMDWSALEDLLVGVAREGAAQAAAELLSQGVTVLAPSDLQLRMLVTDQAAAVAQQTADGLSIAASRKAVQLVGERSAREVADETVAYLLGLEHRWERDQLAGAVQAASNAGRFAVFDRVPGDLPVGYYASELLDAATCDECLDVDGTEYPDVAAAMRAYPSGGYHRCKGGPRCRGTVVAALPESEAPEAIDDPFGLFAPAS